MTQTQNFAGANSLGYVTGNNSGVYPDAVIKEDYVAFQGQVGAFQLSGLNLSKTYDLTFFGSENLYGDNTGAYVVNGDTVFLNAMYNSNATVTMRGLQPDINGILNVQIMPYGVNSGGGWINAMVIQGFNASGYTAPTPPVSTGGANSLVVTGARAATLTQDAQTALANAKLNAYPNPFHQFFTLSVPAAVNDEKVQVTIYDMGGRLAYMKEFSGLIQGDNYLRVDTDGSIPESGVYIVKVVYSDRKTVKTFKLIKE
jgi:large repetitive protein